MRVSCNGCRVLRKGCSEDCSIKPCLQWIKSPESQANATAFLAKFYGRAGLLNLIHAGPEHLRPAIFRSLLYEACGRIINPIYGSVGLLWSGSWSLCQNAVESVLKGGPIIPIGSELAEKNNGPPLKPYDICHHASNENELHKVQTRPRFKKSGSKPAKVTVAQVPEPSHDESHESSLSHQSVAALVVEAESLGSACVPLEPARDLEIGLELTLGFEPVHKKINGSTFVGRFNGLGLGLDCQARE